MFRKARCAAVDVGRRCSVAAVVGAVVALLPQTGRAQTPQSAGVDPACECRIVLRRVAALGDDNDEVAFRPTSVLARDPAGRYFAGVTHSPSSIAVFAPNGNPLPPFGRQGEGPGEMERIRYVRAAYGDSIIVLDRPKLTLFASSGSPVRWGTLPRGVAAFRFAVLKSGHVVVNNYFPTHPSFVLLDRKFTGLREFGSTTPPDSRSDSDAIQYHLVGLDSGRFAAVRQYYRYGVEIWDTTGSLVRRFDRIPSWYQPWTEADKHAAARQLSGFPVIEGVHADGQRLWVAARVPDPTWKDPAAKMRAPERGREVAFPAIPVPEYNRRYDSVIEVLDVATGRVLVSQRFDAYVSQFTEGGFMYSVREAPSSLLRIDVWRAEIVRVP